jgi:hypothetical protein
MNDAPEWRRNMKTSASPEAARSRIRMTAAASRGLDNPLVEPGCIGRDDNTFGSGNRLSIEDCFPPGKKSDLEAGCWMLDLSRRLVTA